MTASRHLIRPKWRPTAVDIELMRRHFSDSRTQDLAEALGVDYGQVARLAQRLGLKKSPAFLAGKLSGRIAPGGAERGAAGRFGRGHEPWNKGVKGLQLAPATQFRAGQCNGHAAQLVKPLGAQRINSEGYLERKVSDQPGPPNLRWVPVHRLVWEAAHGPVPPACIVVFRPGLRTADPELITLDRLECISRAENMRRNSVHAKYPPELARITQLRGVLTRQINQREQQQQQAKEAETT